VVKTVPPDNKVVISEVLVLTLLSNEDSSVSILETALYVPSEGIILPEESNSNIVPSPLPVLGVNPEMLNEVIVDALITDPAPNAMEPLSDCSPGCNCMLVPRKVLLEPSLCQARALSGILFYSHHYLLILHHLPWVCLGFARAMKTL